jgi:MarR family transcriptional regulator, transcriptional regulator for hemolysin
MRMFNDEPPIGFVLAQTAKFTTRKFEEKLIAAGGSLSTWLVLVALHHTGSAFQAELADSVGIQGPTLTHHLNSLEQQGFITRTRLKEDRRAHRVDITPKGRDNFIKLRHSAKAYDVKLSKAISNEEMQILRDILKRLAAAVSAN